ncbi:MAG: hypothetical protein M3268_05960 [Acidobacteriota bacterium]|nr:hypothetical protein [Acidobacteriota bacterium]
MRNVLIIGATAALLFACACNVSVGGNSNATTPAASNTASATNNSTTSTTTTTNTTSTTTRPGNTVPANNNSSSQEGGKQDFTVVNQTGVEIHRLYVSPHDKDDWEEDILGRDTLASGESLDIKFDRSEKAKMWDLRVEDKQGNAIEWENLNLLEISKVTLHYKDGKAWADTE